MCRAASSMEDIPSSIRFGFATNRHCWQKVLTVTPPHMWTDSSFYGVSQFPAPFLWPRNLMGPRLCCMEFTCLSRERRERVALSLSSCVGLSLSPPLPVFYSDVWGGISFFPLSAVQSAMSRSRSIARSTVPFSLPLEQASQRSRSISFTQWPMSSSSVTDRHICSPLFFSLSLTRSLSFRS